MENNDVEERKRLKNEVRVLAMAKDIKFVLKQKGFRDGKTRMGARYFFVEPFDISKPVESEKLKRIREAKVKKQERFLKVGMVEFEHPLSLGEDKFVGPIIKYCLENILQNLGKEKVAELTKTGAVFSVRKKNVPENLETRTATVQAIIFQPVKKDELKEIRNQHVIVGKEILSPTSIEEKIVAYQKDGKQK